VLLTVGMVGVASAEGNALQVSVQGVASVPIAQTANAAEATAVYRTAMAAAIADGKSKAEFLTSSVGGSLGPAQIVTEDGGSIGCTAAGETYPGAEYLGEQPDFGYGSSVGVLQSVTAPETAAAKTVAPSKPKPVAVKHHTRHKKHKAKKATAVSCKLSTQVGLSYAIAYPIA